MLRSSRRAALLGTAMLWSLLALSACPGSTPPATTQPAPAPAKIVDSQEPESAIGGSYECRLRTADDDLSGPCEIIANDANAFEIRIALGTHHIEGTAQRTSYGLRFDGSLDQKPVTADLIKQGARSFGAVLQLDDKQLFKLDIAPSG